MTSFSSAVKVAKRYSENQKYFCGLFGNIEKNYGEITGFCQKLLSYLSVDEC